MFLSLLIVFFTTSFILLFGCNNQTSIEEYDIREKCGKQSEEWLKSYQPNYLVDKFTYKNHYNKKLNKCFIYTASFYSAGYQTLHFTDVNENKEYGNCDGMIDEEETFSCKFLDKDVKSKKDWEKLVTPYMEE